MELNNFGEMEFQAANEMNVPVNIHLERNDGNHYDIPNDHWILIADNFMPRKARVTDRAYGVSAPTREVLVILVQNHILPLYQIALQNAVV